MSSEKVERYPARNCLHVLPRYIFSSPPMIRSQAAEGRQKKAIQKGSSFHHPDCQAHTSQTPESRKPTMQICPAALPQPDVAETKRALRMSPPPRACEDRQPLNYITPCPCIIYYAARRLVNPSCCLRFTMDYIHTQSQKHSRSCPVTLILCA